MPIRLDLERPDQPEVERLIDALDAYQRPLYPAESHHGIDLTALREPSVLFAVARGSNDAPLACGAVKLEAGYGELKRMYTTPAHRGLGVGKALLTFLESEAQARGCTRFTLETGYLQNEALGLYARAGYSRCAPFGDYVEDPNSVFLQKTVAADSKPRDVSVWRATVADVPDLAPLFDGYRQFYGCDSDPYLADHFLRERLTRRESVVLLARDGRGGVVGFVQLYPVFSSVRAKRVLLLNDLFVSLRSRRNGTGRLLLEAATRFAHNAGVTRLKLSTAVSNTPAQRLYESLGWVRDTGFYEYSIDVTS